VKPVTPISTEQVREASSKGFVCSLGYTSVSDTQFDLWLVTERHRVADLATAKERERIIKLLHSDEGRNILVKGDNAFGSAIMLEVLIKGEKK
jgi:hypothetical protein